MEAEHVGQTLLDASSFLPVVGTLKNTDEIAALCKQFLKNAPTYADAAKNALKNADNLPAGAKRALDSSGNIKTHTLMHIQKQRYKQEDYNLYGNPKDIDGRIRSDMTVASAGLMNRCQDILSGDADWLTNYPDPGTYSRHVARFLAPYFQRQGYYVKQTEEY